MSKHILVSIPASHYCERARWALDYAGIPFEECKWPPLLHLLGTVPAGGKSVPLLKCPRTAKQRGKVLTDSADIVRYAHEQMLAASPSSAGAPAPSPLYPSDPEELKEVRRLEELFARKLGVWARVVAYHWLFGGSPQMGLDVLALRQGPPASGPDPRPGSSRGSPGLAGWKARALVAAFPLVRAAIRRGYRVDEAAAAQCLGRVGALFEEVGERLRSDGRGYLVGGRFSAADLTFAALAAPLLLPPAYGAYLPPPAQFGPGSPAAPLRDTVAGRHAMRMYELHREQPAALAAVTLAAAAAVAEAKL